MYKKYLAILIVFVMIATAFAYYIIQSNIESSDNTEEQFDWGELPPIKSTEISDEGSPSDIEENSTGIKNSEVLKHAVEHDCWIIIDANVYDISSVLIKTSNVTALSGCGGKVVSDQVVIDEIDGFFIGELSDE